MYKIIAKFKSANFIEVCMFVATCHQNFKHRCNLVLLLVSLMFIYVYIKLATSSLHFLHDYQC